MKHGLFLLAILASLPGRGQVKEIDSLQTALRQTHTPEKRIDLLNSLSFIYYKISLDKSTQFANQAKDEASSSGYQKGLAEAFNNLGICASIQGNLSSGLDYFIKSLRIRETSHDDRGAARTLNNIAGIYLFQKEYDKAISYSEKSLSLQQKYNGPENIGQTLVSIALIYIEKKDTAEAIRRYSLALEQFARLSDKRHEITTRVRLEILQKKKNTNEILTLCLMAIKNAESRGDSSIAIELYKITAEQSAEAGSSGQALTYYRKALSMADRYNDNQEQMKIRMGLSVLFQRQGKFDSALKYYKSYADLNQQTFTTEKANQMAMLGKVYETEKKDQMLESNQQKIRSQATIIAVISILLSMLLGSGIILYRFYRQKRLANIKLQELISAVSLQSAELREANLEIKRINENLEGEVSRRIQEIKIQDKKLTGYAYANAHEVRGPLARIMGLVNLIKHDLTAEEMKELNKKIEVAAVELDLVIRDISDRLDAK